MLHVLDDGTIQLTRGDTAYLSMSISNDATGQPYEVRPHDILTLTVKKTVKDSEVRIQKMITGTNVFHILPTDTHTLDFGKYVYDVQITTEASDVYTVIGPCTFEVLKEVTY